MPIERPILFSAAMVRAILDGQKTQTRRVVKPQPDIVHGDIVGRYTPDDMRLGRLGEAIRCPYGQPGDRLWVRETWRPRIVHSCFDMGCDCETVWVDYPAGGEGKVFHGKDIPDEWCMPQAALKGRPVPSLHMPRWASRITLEIVSKRVERLQDITYDDAIAEGMFDPGSIRDTYPPTGETGEQLGRRLKHPQRSFALLWEELNGSGAWDANPWVWVVEFRRV